MDINVLINTIDGVKKFNKIMMGYDCDLDLTAHNRRYVIDAKSLMGIFSLDLSHPLTLTIHSSDQMLIDHIKIDIAEFVC